MKQEMFAKNLKEAIKKRNAYLLMALGLLISNLLLLVLLFAKKERTIIIPPALQKTIWLEENKVSESYLEEMSLWFCHLMLDCNSSNQKLNHKTLLNHVSPKTYSKLMKQLLEDERRYEEDGLMTYFSPQEVETNLAKKEAYVTGKLNSYVGSKEVDSSVKIFLVKFSYENGRLYLTKFQLSEQRETA